MRDNESLREFVKRFGQAVLQIEACSMDAVLQIFKQSICPDTPFFESLAKKPPTTMDDLFRRANKYSMLEDDVRAATQQVLVAGRASKGDAERNAKPPDRPGSACPTSNGLDPSERTHPQGIVVGDVPSTKDHGHTTETCRALQYLVERLIKVGHLKQYLRSDAGGRDASQHHNSGTPRAPVAPKAVINYINGGPSDEEYDSRRKRQKLLRAASVRETHQFYPAWINWREPLPHRWDNHLSTSRSHPDTATTSRHPHLVPGNRDFDVRRILVDPGSSADLIQASVVSHMGHSLTGLENPGRILSGFNGSSTTSLGRHCTAGPSWPSHSQRIILGGTRVITLQYHLGAHMASLHESHPLYIPSNGIHPSIASHKLNVFQLPDPSGRRSDASTRTDKKSSGMRLTNVRSEFIREVSYPDWLANVVVVPKKKGKWRVCVDYTNLNNACPKDSFPLPRIDQIVDSTSGQGMLSFLDAFSGYHQIPMSPDDEEKTAFITPHGLYCYKVMPFRLKNAGATYQRLMTKIFNL
ncbi:Transposon Ty3-I Gag-Pol polyprotein [Vitis vinifera]|uniref:Transposon Ty3-I Gag-Pol polyprotein n=1 Tax=Vitis vinifera TaxID=29760 RepID=A0A438FA13_VITVI|nr:Transposon Ty3-I Gag-Pol polyprotein [Vitis vinifera]